MLARSPHFLSRNRIRPNFNPVDVRDEHPTQALAPRIIKEKFEK